MADSKIDWCDKVWNPITGCTKIAAGCKNCYAEKMAARLARMGVKGYNNNIINSDGKWTGGINLLHKKLNDPEEWIKPQVVFVNSMSDLFHTGVPDGFIEEVFMEMAHYARQHNYIILTKRPERMRDFMNGHHEYIQEHIWLGVSVSTQNNADEFLPILCDTPAGKRIVSAEPLLEEIDLEIDIGQGVGDLAIDNLDLVIAGCESGSSRRHVNTDAFRLLRDQCQVARVDFYLKQMEIADKVVHGSELDGKVWDELPWKNR